MLNDEAEGGPYAQNERVGTHATDGGCMGDPLNQKSKRDCLERDSNESKELTHEDLFSGKLIS